MRSFEQLFIGVGRIQWREIRPWVVGLFRAVVFALVLGGALVVCDMLHTDLIGRVRPLETEVAYLRGAARPLVKAEDGAMVHIWPGMKEEASE
jgi:hypothetical protein